MIHEPFAEGNSLINRIDPRYKIIFATVFSFIIALSGRFYSLIFAILVSFVLMCLARLSPGAVGKRLAVIFWFLILMWAVLPITYEGDPLYQMGPLTFTHPGVVLSAQITLKSIAILCTFMSLLATMTIATLGHSLDCLRVPKKLTYLLLITYRYIFVIEQEYQRLVRSAKIRGFKSGTNIHSYKTFAYLAGMLFVRASERANRVHRAMLCRGFNGRFYTLYSFTPNYRDWIFSGSMSVIIICICLIEWTKFI